MTLLSKPRSLTLTLASLGIALLTTVATAQGSWTATRNTMTTARDAHAMVTVGTKVLVIGGRTNANGTTTSRTDYYDPATGLFSATGSMLSSRSFFPAVLLDNGKVLAPGGYQQSFSGGTIRSCELFNPSTNKWGATSGSMSVAREQHSGTKLPNGTVLVAGGFSNGAILSSAELYNPSTSRFTATATPMQNARFGHTATLLTLGPNAGKVLVIGGRTANNVSLAATEFYDPGTGRWSAGPNLNQDRYRHTTTVLNDGTGRLLITGGYSSIQGNTLATAEIYDPNVNAFTLVTDPLTSQPLLMSATRMDHSAVCLPDGRVLLAGGWSSTVQNPDGSFGSTVASADLFDPMTGSFQPAAGLSSSRHEQAALLLGNGAVLVTGGLHWEPSLHKTLNEAWLYTP